MFKGELTILEETKENRDRFHPLRYWISSSVSGNDYKISRYIDIIQPGLKRTKIFGDSKTLHIGTFDEVISNSGKNIYFISEEVLYEAAENKLSHFQVSRQSPQCASLCLYGLCFTASGFSRHEFIEIVDQILLLGGEFVPMTEADKIDVFITNCPVLPSIISIFASVISIVTDEWVAGCFAQRKKLDYSDYSISPFSQITLTSSDLESYQNRNIKSKVQKGGGVWNEAFDDSVTFLIASHISSTPKVRLALQMSVPIIKPSWVDDQSNSLVSIEPYILNYWCLNNFLKNSLFENVTFAIHVNCEDRDSIIEAVKANSGSFASPPDYLIVPHLYQGSADQKCVTTSWIWNCITEKKIIDPDSSILYRPFPYSKPSSKLLGYVVVIYNIGDPIKYEITECLRALGIIVHYRISDLSNIVVASKVDDLLFNNSKKHNVQIVGLPFVQQLIRTGKLPPIQKYLLENPKVQSLKSICNLIRKKNYSAEVNLTKNDNYQPSQAEKLTQEAILNVFSDDEEANTSPNAYVTYGSSERKNDSLIFERDPLLEILSKF